MKQFFLVFVLCIASAGSCVAETFSWTNTASGDWSVSDNWTNEAGVAAAPFLGGQTNLVLNFSKVGTYTANHNLNNDFLLNQLTVGGPSLTLAGNSLTFTNSGAVLPQINQKGSLSLIISNNLVLVANTTLGGNGSGAVTLRGNLLGTGSLTKTNAGTLTFNSLMNTYSGGTIVKSGALSCGSTANTLFGSGSVTVNAGASLNLNGNNNITNALILDNATVANGNSFSANWYGPITLVASSSFDVATTGKMNLGGNISGAGGITKLGVSQGPVVISGSNTFTGPISVKAGLVNVASLNSVSGGTATSNLGAPADAASGTIALGSTTTTGELKYSGAGETTDRIIKMGGTTGGVTITQAGTSSGLPTTRGTSGLLKFTNDLFVLGNAGVDNRKTLTLTHATDPSNGYALGSGELAGAIGDSVLGLVNQRSTSVTKAGTGTWTLSGVNTYSGMTRIQTGTLAFARCEALGTNALDISEGAKARLDYVGIRQIGALTFNGGSAQPSGSYGSSASPATYKDDTHFSGIGTILIGTPAGASTSTAFARTTGSNPSAGGSLLTFTATVTGSTPTGYVSFYDGLTFLGSNTLNGSFQASLNISTLTSGTHMMTALYAGNGANAPSASTGLVQTVTEGRPATTTTLARTSGTEPSARGAGVTFTATVTGAAPNGEVAFFDGDTAIGLASLNGSSQASLMISSLAAGWHPITAQYLGNTNNAPSTSTHPLVQTVKPSPGNGKLKVFILAGQSNMQGKGQVEYGRNPNNLYGPTIVGGLGSLRNMVNRDSDKYGYLLDNSSYANTTNTTVPGWLTLTNVWVSYFTSGAAPTMTEARKGYLDADFGDGARQGRVGPEYGFGLAVGSQLGDPVLIIKTAWGGTSLVSPQTHMWTPPSSGGTTGDCYTTMVAIVHQTLNNLTNEFTNFQYSASNGYEIAGFGWHQGWNDGGVTTAAYETNLVNLIKDLRTEFGVPNLPVSIGNTGMANQSCLTVLQAQLNVSNPVLHPEFAGTVTTIDTRPLDVGPLLSPIDQGYHWNGNAESYFKIGEQMGMAMVSLVTSASATSNTLLNVGASGVETNAATLTATLSAPESNFDVFAHWNTVNGNTDPVLWTNAVYVGTYTNVASTNISIRVTGLTPNRSYFFTFKATNETETIWAPVVLGFDTPPAPNSPPVIAEGAVTNVVMSEDGSPLLFSLTLHASDSDGGTLTWSISTNVLAQHGTPSASGTGSSQVVGYTPVANFYGADSFTVQVSNGQGGTATILVDVTILSENDAPTTNGIVTTQTVTDSDMTGSQVVTLDASNARDDDGSIVSYTWSEGAVQLATGVVASVNLALGVHSVTLEIMDNDGLVSTLHLTLTVIAQSAYLMEDFEYEWADNALANSTNQWSSSGASDISSITNPAVGYSRLPFDVPFPLVYNHATQRRVLQVNTRGDLLLTPVLEANFSRKKVYVDMMAKFGLCETLPSAMTNELNVKAAMFLHKNGSSTNLVVFHGQKTEGGFGTSTFTPVADGFDLEAWYRLTLTFDATTNNSGAEAFSVRINGDPLISSQAYGDSWKSSLFQSPIPDGGTWFLSASRRLEATGTNLTTVTGLSFEGEGFVDDLVVTPYQPVFGCGTVIMFALCTGNSGIIQELMAL